MSIAGFQTLHCPTCKGTHVLTVNELRWQEGKGSALSFIGYYCLSCLKPFDFEGAIRTIKTKELEAKIKELEVQSGR